MTIPYAPAKAVFVGNNVAVDFPFAFRVWDARQLQVVITDPDDLSVTVTGWTVVLTDNGGTVTFRKDGQPLPAGWKLAILRDMPFEQGVDLVNGAQFHPEVVETQMDVATAERQQLKEAVDRSIKVPPTSENPPELLADMLFEARDRAESAAKASSLCRDQSCECADYAWGVKDELGGLSFSAHLSDTPNAAVEYTPQTGMVHFYLPPGPQGLQGGDGKQGPPGPQGVRGATGAGGPAGLQGRAGPEGRQGIQGPAGPKGESGERGLQGTPGPQGARGDKGPMGDAPWAAAFGQFRLEGAGLFMDYAGAELDATFTLNPVTGRLEVIV